MFFRIFASAAAVAAACLSLSGVARAQTTPPAGDSAAFFVLDFNDGAGSSFGFQYNYATGQSLTASSLIEALAATPLTPQLTETHINYGGSLGYYYTAFGYGSQYEALTSDYGYGYTLYTSANGTIWTEASLGASSTTINSAAPYIAFSYGPTGYTSSGSPITPVSPSSAYVTVNASTAPEPHAVALLLFGGAGACVALCRRRA